MNKLEEWSPRIWPLTLGLGLLVLLVAGTSLYLTITSNRPELVATNASLYNQSNGKSGVQFSWINIGKRPARQGAATLFSVSDDGNRYDKLETGKITTFTVAPSGNAYFSVSNLDASRLL
jgi:hypothetical protein